MVLAGLGIAAVSAGRNLIPMVRPAGCEVAGLAGGWFGFDPERLEHAATISAVAMKRGLPDRAAVVATATALQESKLHNLSHGDRDSVGLFQQRPSQGWGTQEQILDPVYATNAFYDRLVKVPRYQQRPLTEVAQEVQRSGFPDAYARHEAEATALVHAFTEGTPGAVACRLGEPAIGTPAARVGQAATRELGVTMTVQPDGHSLRFRTSRPHWAWRVGTWAVAAAERFGVESVTVGDSRWLRSMDLASLTWQDVAPELAANALGSDGADQSEVVVRLAVPAQPRSPTGR